MTLPCYCNDTATTRTYTLSLQTLFRSDRPSRRACAEEDPLSADFPDRRLDCSQMGHRARLDREMCVSTRGGQSVDDIGVVRSEEHTSELQPQANLVCRFLLSLKCVFLP